MTRGALALLCVVAVALWPLSGGRAVWPSSRARHPRWSGRVARTWRRVRRRPRRQLDDATADLLGVLAPPLRAGAPPLTALVAAQRALGEDAPGSEVVQAVVQEVVEEVVRAGHAGRSLADAWSAEAARLDSAALRFVGAAWSVSETTGAPLAEALVCAEQVLRVRRRSADRLRAAVAGPRASMTVLVLLPLSGPVVGLVCGVGPRDLYLSSPVATASLLVGVVWAALAWLWAARLVRGAS